MASPKDGTECTLVDPASPNNAQDADDADPGQVDSVKAQQQQTASGKYGSAKVDAFKSDKDKKHWIEISMVDEENDPVPGLKYKITLPDGTVDEGTLNEKGSARLEGIDPGTCQVTFPDLDQDAWKPA